MSSALPEVGAAATGGPSQGGAVFVWPSAPSVEQIDSLYRQNLTEDESPDSQYRAMSTMLLADTSESERSAILVDEMFVLLNWCEEQALQPQQTAIVIRCALDILKQAANSEIWPSREASFEFFKNALLAAAVGPGEQLLLPVYMLERVTEHTSQAFYVRWKALQFAFTQPEGVEDVRLLVSVDTPMPKPALASGKAVGEVTIAHTGTAPAADHAEYEQHDSARGGKGSKKSPRSGRKK